MRTAIKVILIGAGLAALPAAAMLGSSLPFDAPGTFQGRMAHATTTSSQGKDQARIEPAAMGLGRRDVAKALVELAQAPPAHGPLPFPPGAGMGHDHPPLPGHPGPGGHFGPPGLLGMGGPHGFAGPSADGTPPSPRRFCEEHINFAMAGAAYLKGKLRLQANQKDAWQKLEQAAEPVVEKMRDACAQLPTQMGTRPSLPDAIELAERHLAVRIEFLRAIREPLRALYETLSADQRAVLDRPVGRPHWLPH